MQQYPPQGYYPTAPGQMQAMVPPPVVIDANALIVAEFKGGETAGGATWTYSPNALAIVKKTKLHDQYKCMICCPIALCFLDPIRCMCSMATASLLCDYCYFEEKIQPRSYQVVYENRLEFNYPYHQCCGCCVKDAVYARYFDRISTDFSEAKCCSPYHCCYCTPISIAGDILSEAPCACVNGCLCSCCRTYYPAIENAQDFVAALSNARSAFKDGNRLVPRFLPRGPVPAEVIPS